MHSVSIVSTVRRCFPVFTHWMHLRAFRGATVFATGIAMASGIPLALTCATEKLYYSALAGAIVAITAGVLCRKIWISSIAFLIAGVAVVGFHRIGSEQTAVAIRQLQKKQVHIAGDIITAPAPRRDRFVWLLRLGEVNGTSTSPLCGKIFTCSSALLPQATGTLSGTGSIVSPDTRKNRFDFDEESYFRANGIAGKIRVDQLLAVTPPESWHAKAAAWFREQVITVLKTYPNPDHRALVRASFLNEKAYLAPEIKTAFRRSGLYHLLALSGLHAGILLAAVYLLLSLVPIAAVVRHLLALGTLWVYYLYIGPVPSLARATVMATVVIATLLLQRKNYPLQSLGLAAIIWLFWSPASLGQAGFQFSFLATFGILTLHPIFVNMVPRHQHPVVDYGIRLLLVPFSVSFSALCTTLPALLWHFGMVSLYGFAANIVGALLMTVGMWLFFTGLLTASILPAVSRLAISGSSLSLDGLMNVAERSVSLPISSINLPVPYPEMLVAFSLLFIMVVTVSKPSRRKLLLWGVPLLCCLIPADYLLHRATAGIEVVRFDTGTNRTEVTAVRQPNGGTTLFCRGNASSVNRVIRNSVLPWSRHLPGSTIRQTFIAPDGKKSRSGNRAPKTGVPVNEDIQQVFPGGWLALPCTTYYVVSGTIPAVRVTTGTTQVLCRGNRVSWRSGSAASIDSGSVGIPIVVATRGKACRVMPFH